MSSSMDDLEVFPRQAVIVKNGKIFVEDEPFICSRSCDDNEGQDKLRKLNKAEEGAQSMVQDRKTSDTMALDDFDSEKENHFTPDLIAEQPRNDDDDEDQEKDDNDDGDEDNEEEEEQFVRFLGQEEFFEDMDSLRVRSSADSGVRERLLEEFTEGVCLPAVLPSPEDVEDPLHYFDCFSSVKDVQRISVITALPSLLRENNDECMRRIVPKVRESLYVAPYDVQLAAASAFLQILQDKLVPLHSYTQTFLHIILSRVDSKDDEVSAAWLGTLLDVIDLLPTEIIKNDILGIAIIKGQLQQPVPARLSCCKILGKMATKFESFLIKKEILPLVQQLCQDVEHEVRACMCCQLDSVARGLGLENMKSAILPELVELTNDEESIVRISGLQTVVKILPILDQDTLTMTIVPLVCKLCQKAMQAEDSTLPVVAKLLGQLCSGLHSILTEEQKLWFVDYYRKLCKTGLSDKLNATEKNILVLSSFEEEDRNKETRRCAAYNFPAMAFFVGAQSFKSELLSTLSALCRDPHNVVRKTIASSFHELSRMMGIHVTLLFPDLKGLLQDESIEVLEGAVLSIPYSVEILSRKASTLSEGELQAVQELVSIFLSAEAVVFTCKKWRMQENMMSSLGCMAPLCSQDLLYNTVVPLLLDKMKRGRALPVRHAAARSLLKVMRSLHRLEWREHIVHTLIKDFCHGRSCHSRALFIVICKYVIELYSKAFFKEHFFEYALSLTSDLVPNIRMRMCCLLPSLKRLIKLPHDNSLERSLDQCVHQVLVAEKDRDVLTVIKQAEEELDGIHVQMKTMNNFEDDLEDQAKEGEEKQLLEMEERKRQEEERPKNSKKESTRLPGLRKIPPASKAQSGGGAKVDIPLARKDSKSSTATSTCRSEGRPSTPPRKEPGSTRIPVYHSLLRSGCSVDKLKASPSSQRNGNIQNAVIVVSNKLR